MKTTQKAPDRPESVDQGPLMLPAYLYKLGRAHRQPQVLHIGCGKRKVSGAVTMDINPVHRPDFVWDLNRFPYPLEDSSFDLAVCEHVLEHLKDVVGVMEELHRVLRPGGKVCIRVPHFSSLNANTDPTHTRRFSSRSMDYFCVGTHLSSYDYTHVRFRKLVARMTMNPLTRKNGFIMGLINRNLDLYEERLAGIIPGQELLFVLEVIK